MLDFKHKHVCPWKLIYTQTTQQYTCPTFRETTKQQKTIQSKLAYLKYIWSNWQGSRIFGSRLQPLHPSPSCHHRLPTHFQYRNFSRRLQILEMKTRDGKDMDQLQSPFHNRPSGNTRQQERQYLWWISSSTKFRNLPASRIPARKVESLSCLVTSTATNCKSVDNITETNKIITIELIAANKKTVTDLHKKSKLTEQIYSLKNS